ncbi:hypothetical protein [Sphingomonas flavalba]|uniref:hypothetical protein n=1 Tax=Sphingomonas flavalba TaxID=2559804 RepID=UPI001EF08B85|nr:hypothetical protein [Sphingomonas flavalba]
MNAAFAKDVMRALDDPLAPFGHPGAAVFAARWFDRTPTADCFHHVGALYAGAPEIYRHRRLMTNIAGGAQPKRASAQSPHCINVHYMFLFRHAPEQKSRRDQQPDQCSFQPA